MSDARARMTHGLAMVCVIGALTSCTSVLCTASGLWQSYDDCMRSEEREAIKARTREQQQRDCERRDPEACYHAGSFNVSNERAEEGAAQLQFACDKDVAAGCEVLGRYLWQGWVIKKDEPRALALFRRGCTLGSDTSCREVEYALAEQRNKH